MQQQLSINADCTALNCTAEKDNERTTKNESGLQVYVHFAGSLFLFLIKKIQYMSIWRIQTDVMHFKANGNWLMYSL